MTSRAPPPRPDPSVIAKRLEHGSVLVHLPSNRIFELNETGTRVWELLGSGHDIDSIVSQLVKEFEVDAITAAEKVEDLLMRLRSEGLLT